MRTIKFFQSDYHTLSPEIDAAVRGVLHSGDYIRGTQCATFERSLGEYLEIDNVVAVGNGTDALMISYLGLGLKAGDEIIIPAFNYIAAAEAAVLLGLIPVFVDVCQDSFCIDPDKCYEAITDKTRAIVIVHLFGHPVEMFPFLAMVDNKPIFLIEDFAQALGSQDINMCGTDGHIGCTSFYPTKNLGCFGDGGAIVTADPLLAEHCRMIANHGQKIRYNHEFVGMNSRLDEIQAAILNVKLEYLNTDIAIRRDIATFYDRNINDDKYGLPYMADGHTFHQFSLQLSPLMDRNKFRGAMFHEGIPTAVYYDKLTPDQGVYNEYFVRHMSPMPNALKLSRNIVQIPIHPCMDQLQMEFIVKTLNEYKG